MVDRVAARSNVQDRRTLIAEAALELLAREGARGLTHRAVDRELAFPDGNCKPRRYFNGTLSRRLGSHLIRNSENLEQYLRHGFHGASLN